MAAPEHVPVSPTEVVRGYESPPRRPDSWRAERPADFAGERPQPRGRRLGSPGPDQGYGLKLARHFADDVRLAEGEHWEDAVAGCTGVAMKRASLFGRAPVIHDLRIAFTIWGFLDPTPDADLATLRRAVFEEVAHAHHYAERQTLVDMVPEEALRLTPDEVAERHRQDWRSLLVLG